MKGREKEIIKRCSQDFIKNGNSPESIASTSPIFRFGLNF